MGMRIDRTVQINKWQFYMMGGLQNPNLWRKQVGKSWQYYQNYQG